MYFYRYFELEELLCISAIICFRATVLVITTNSFVYNLQGRTGTMICILSLYRGIFRDAETCLQYFGDQRTDLRVDQKFQVRDTCRASECVSMYEYIL